MLGNPFFFFSFKSGSEIRLQLQEIYRGRYEFESGCCFGAAPVPRAEDIVLDIGFGPGFDAGGGSLADLTEEFMAPLLPLLAGFAFIFSFPQMGMWRSAAFSLNLRPQCGHGLSPSSTGAGAPPPEPDPPGPIGGCPFAERIAFMNA
eukprot:TRINITY_DN2220_c0_g1_i2.p2 TRINITY_DN2220_c0_g1~~TRINITY_DN2220_c0_g1_i2.p2  ORF type:complete len:147 (-),score=19.06 TRINITY_DN2220_c0_g1_i2:1275-1715(-)